MKGPFGVRTATITEEREGEHSYLASSADLMIGLLFIFIIMVAFLALQRRNEQAVSEQKLASAAAAEAAAKAALVKIGDLALADPRGFVTTKIGDGVRTAIPNVDVNPQTGAVRR